MTSLFDTRRYLTNFDSTLTGHLITDVLVIGSGIAGARAAVEAARFGTVTIVTKGPFEESATRYAQGGIAAAIGRHDSPEKHYQDTLRVGCSLNRPEAVRLLTEQGPICLEEMIEWGMKLDRVKGQIALTREGGHSVNRIVHADGDRTGEEVVSTLSRLVRSVSSVRVLEHCFLIDLLTLDGVCVGATTYHEKYGHQLIWAKQIILASGGCGTIWRETTNPRIATGDGMAAAFRAGAIMRDLELMQFHPTTLYVAGAARALISEAVRGEGAYLVDKKGDRFMTHYHADAELAPRDVVCQSLHRHLSQTGDNCVYLDVRHIGGFTERFPHIAQLCRDFEIDVSREMIPVRPSAHYMIGGVETELDGSTSVDGLLACGEVTCSGVHGANRLASNSLLEGLVFGKIAGQAAGQRAVEANAIQPVRKIANARPPSPRTQLDLIDIRNSLRSVMWRNVGIERDGARLLETCDIVSFWGHYTLDKVFDDPAGWEVQNQLTVARLIAEGALERTNSIGVHQRTDTPPTIRSPLYHVVTRRDPVGSKPGRVYPDGAESS